MVKNRVDKIHSETYAFKIQKIIEKRLFPTDIIIISFTNPKLILLGKYLHIHLFLPAIF